MRAGGPRDPKHPIAWPAAAPGAAAPAPRPCADLFARADALFADLTDGVMIQRDGRIVYANPRLAALLGYGDPSELVASVALELYPESALPSVITRLQAAYFGRPAHVIRHALRRRDGGTVEVDVSSLLLQAAGSRLLIEVLRPVADPRARGGAPGLL